MTKRRIQPKMGYFLIWKEFVLVDFRQWIRQHVQFCKKIHSVVIKFLWSWTEDQFRDDIFLVLLKRMPKGHTEMVSFYWQTWEEVTFKRNLWSFEKFWFYWSWCSKLSGKKKKKRSKFTETGQANCNAIMQTTSFGFMNKERVSVWQFLWSSHARKCVDKRRWIFVFTRLKLFECSTKKLTGLTILLLCTWRKRGENNSKMFQKIFP